MVSVAPASNVQVIPLPEPKVVDPTSVVSRLITRVPAPLSEVSTPLVPPDSVRVAPKAVVELPESPANVIVELSSSALLILVPKVVERVLLVTRRPVPANSEIVSPPTTRAPVVAVPVTEILVEKVQAPVTDSF